MQFSGRFRFRFLRRALQFRQAFFSVVELRLEPEREADLRLSDPRTFPPSFPDRFRGPLDGFHAWQFFPSVGYHGQAGVGPPFRIVQVFFFSLTVLFAFLSLPSARFALISRRECRHGRRRPTRIVDAGTVYSIFVPIEVSVRGTHRLTMDPNAEAWMDTVLRSTACFTLWRRRERLGFCIAGTMDAARAWKGRSGRHKRARRSGVDIPAPFLQELQLPIAFSSFSRGICCVRQGGDRSKGFRSHQHHPILATSCLLHRHALRSIHAHVSTLPSIVVHLHRRRSGCGSPARAMAASTCRCTARRL